MPIGFPVGDGSGEYRYVMFTVAVNGRISTLKTRGYKEDGFIYSLDGVRSGFDHFLGIQLLTYVNLRNLWQYNPRPCNILPACVKYTIVWFSDSKGADPVGIVAYSFLRVFCEPITAVHSFEPDIEW